ncbi:hypothetical protein CRM22_006302 [Opisthorchis felineus]|uniref:Disease resistance R13L4/SHOC-2-like LRR domain-containing protein n=1 Tax=Opisthorchis felineus TaxID=147828 RepID=A0A4S2LTX7_OPIFE|nr:hypothetical protein CRM22_006302 [Opisthorchis felineus]
MSTTDRPPNKDNATGDPRVRIPPSTSPLLSGDAVNHSYIPSRNLVEPDVSQYSHSPVSALKNIDGGSKSRHKSFNSTVAAKPSFSGANGSDNARKTVLLQPHDGKKFRLHPKSSLRKQRSPDLYRELAECRESKNNVLDLSHCELQQLPNGIFDDLPGLTELYLYTNKLTSLPASIGQLAHLRRLSIQQNMLARLPKEMAKLTGLEVLDLRHNRLEGNLPECLPSLKQLKSLFLKFNKLSNISGIENLKHLTCLVLGQNSLKNDLPDVIGQLTCLTTLDLSNNQITSLPENIGNCTALKSLNLQHNQLQRLPNSIGNLRNLSKLSIKYNQLVEIPQTLANCVLLDEFNVESNQLSSLPNELLLSLPNLVNITLSRNHFTDFPTGGPGQFKNCISSRISSSRNMSYGRTLSYRMTTTAYGFRFPSPVSDLHHWSSVVELNLGSNRLTSLPAEIGELQHLEVLELNFNQLRVLPDEITKLSKLRILGLDSNELESLPEDLSGLVSLQELNVLSNRLTTFPRSVENLPKLKVIKAGENDIQRLPAELGNMSALQELHLNDNLNLNSLPVELSLCKNLKILSLENCPLRDIERNVVEGGSAMIIYFLQQVIQFRHQTAV